MSGLFFCEMIAASRREWTLATKQFSLLRRTAMFREEPW
jgi:hypothetical protein